MTSDVFVTRFVSATRGSEESFAGSDSSLYGAMTNPHMVARTFLTWNVARHAETFIMTTNYTNVQNCSIYSDLNSTDYEICQPVYLGCLNLKKKINHAYMNISRFKPRDRQRERRINQ